MALDLSVPASGNEPLSLDSARGSLLQPPEQPEKSASPTAPAPEPAQTAAETPSGPETTTPAATPTETEPEPLPAIEAPAFWKKAAKEFFASLPRETQEEIVSHERERERNINRQLQEAADKRKTADAEIASASTERQTYQQRLNALIPALQQSLASEFSDIKTPADAATLAATDPSRWAQWRAKVDAVQHAMGEQARLAGEKAKEEQARERQALAEAERKLLETFPEWRDIERGRREIAQITRGLTDEYDVPPEIASRFAQPWEFRLAKDALAYLKAQKAATAALAKPVPKVQSPGTAASKADKAAEDRAAKLKRLEQTGDIEDARGLLRQ